MTSIFAKRREKLLAMKALRDRYIPQEQRFACPQCGGEAERRAVVQNLSVCPLCGYHRPIGAYYRLNTLLDAGSFRELNEKLTTADPLLFPGYRLKLQNARNRTGLNEAVVTATGTIDGQRCVVGMAAFRWAA